MERLNQIGNRNELFTVVSLLALILCVSACLPSRPSWSPDGSKLLYSYYDPTAKESGVVLLDRASGATRSIFLVSEPDEDAGVIDAQWEAGGERVIVLSTSGILLLPLNSPEPRERIELPRGAATIATASPIPEIAGSLYFGGETLNKVDLRTGEVTSGETEETVMLYDAGDTVYYRATRFEPTSDPKSKRVFRAEEFGKLNLEDLTLLPLFELTKRELEEHGIDELSPFMAPYRNGERMAVAGGGPTGALILIFSEAGLQETLVPKLPVEQYVLGHLDWSPDGETLYAAVFSPAKSSGFWIFRGDRMMFSIAEIPMGTAPPRLTTVARMSGKFDDWPHPYGTRIAASPDGSALAASTVVFELGDVKEKDRAPYLVDLKDPMRPVTKFPLHFRPNEPIVAVGPPMN